MDDEEVPSTSNTKQSTSPNKRTFASRSLHYGSPSKEGRHISPSKAAATKISQKYKTRGRTYSPLKGLLPTHVNKRQKEWSDGEFRALVEHICLPSEHIELKGNRWPNPGKESQFWVEAQTHIQMRTGVLRSIGAIRTKVSKWLPQKFPIQADGSGGILLAEKAYGFEEIEMEEEIIHPETVNVPNTPELKRRRSSLVTSSLASSPKKAKIESHNVMDTIRNFSDQEHMDFIKEYCEMLQLDLFTKVTNHMFFSLATKNGIDTYPTDFAELATSAMVRLQQAGKNNVMYKFAKCLGSSKPGTEEPLLPLDRMPFGLIEYQVEFFACTNTSGIRESADYRQFLQMMESEFGERFFKLFRGPMWSGYKPGDEEMKDPLKARVNVACVGHRTILKDLAHSDFTSTPDIQVAALKQLKKANPDGRFWIKLDGTDIKTAIQESHKQQWNGDVDLGDGTLQALRDDYESRRLLAINQNVDAAKIVSKLQEDKQYLLETLETSVKTYQKKLDKSSTSDRKLKEMSWSIVETNSLIEKADQLLVQYSSSPQNISTIHMGVQEDHLEYLRHLFVKKRNPATHVLVIMLSDEQRKQKPYSLPVRYIPYNSLSDKQVSSLVDETKKKMAEYGLKCVGVVTDGEFSTLRTNGKKRPLHIAKVISNVRSSINKLGKKALLARFTKSGENEDGTAAAEQKSALPSSVVQFVHDQLQEGYAIADILNSLRDQLCPAGHNLSTWRPHCPETTTETMKTIVATYEFRNKLNEMKEQGVDFLHHLYVAEEVEHREDHNHLLKRIGFHTREGKFDKLEVSKFDEAMRAGLITQAALVGTRKQSVKDAEKLLSHHVAAFFREKGYSTEADYVKHIADWHEATDGRGLSQEERAAANNNMLRYMMVNWTPWWTSESTMSDVDINRPLDDICGFSRETFIGITTNIESQEARRGAALPPEHPRSSTTDDVECFFSLGHRKAGGQNPTLKEWKYYWRKLIWEFTHRMDKNLPFYYWTLNERYSVDEDIIDFDKSSGTTRLHQLRHRSREDGSIIAPGRSFLPAQHRPKLRQRLYRFEVPLPDHSDDTQDFIQTLMSQYSS